MERSSMISGMLATATSMGRSDEAFNFLNGKRRRDGNDLHLVVGNIGNGIDGQTNQRISSPANQSHDKQTNNKFILY